MGIQTELGKRRHFVASKINLQAIHERRAIQKKEREFYDVFDAIGGPTGETLTSEDISKILEAQTNPEGGAIDVFSSTKFKGVIPNEHLKASTTLETGESRAIAFIYFLALEDYFRNLPGGHFFQVGLKAD